MIKRNVIKFSSVFAKTEARVTLDLLKVIVNSTTAVSAKACDDSLRVLLELFMADVGERLIRDMGNLYKLSAKMPFTEDELVLNRRVKLRNGSHLSNIRVSLLGILRLNFVNYVVNLAVGFDLPADEVNFIDSQVTKFASSLASSRFAAAAEQLNNELDSIFFGR